MIQVRHMIGSTLLIWYKQHGRDLPWRKTRDPYAILVSEIMLQQTQVERVRAFYDRWLKQFPDWKSLSVATNTEIIHAWAGLGYNRRGLMLRDIAKHIVEHGIPNSESDWLTIKGIGPYTAAALSSFSQKQRTLPIDTNIRRVLGRVLLRKHFPDQSDDKAIKDAIDDVLPHEGAYYDVPQAIFDLATSICTKTPNCSICPLKDQCASVQDFLSGSIKTPKRTIKAANETKHRNKPFPDRIYRGRILKLARENKKIEINRIGSLIDPSFDPNLDQTWINNMIERMSKDGMLTKVKNEIKLA